MGGGMKAVLDVYGNGEGEQSRVGAPPCYDSEHGRDGKGKHFEENKECLVTDWRLNRGASKTLVPGKQEGWLAVSYLVV